MGAYVVARLENPRIGEAVRTYLERVDATFAPFGGRFLIHGGPVETLEGAWRGDLVVVAFPDKAAARAWYASDAYRAILPLRTANIDGDVILVEGVGPDHAATDILTAMAPAD